MFTVIWLSCILTIFASILFFSRPNITQRKSRIMHLYSSVLSDMNKDFKDTGMLAMDIHTISKSIENLTREIEGIGKIIDTASIDDKKWLTQIIDEYRIQLRLWIDRHASELDILEEKIASLQINSKSEKSALEFSYQRLENQKIFLEKI